MSGIVGLGGRRSFDSQRGFREHSKEFRQAWLHLANVAAEILHALIRRFRYVFRIAIERGTKAAQAFVLAVYWAECLGPISGESLDMLGVEAVAERIGQPRRRLSPDDAKRR